MIAIHHAHNHNSVHASIKPRGIPSDTYASLASQLFTPSKIHLVAWDTVCAESLSVYC